MQTQESTKRAVEAVLLGQEVGAAHGSPLEGRGSPEGRWFDLPPEAVWSRLPCDPETNKGRELPPADVLGTAQIGVFHVNASPDLQILVTSVRMLIGTPESKQADGVTEDPRWHDLVAAPGRAVPYKIKDKVRDQWDTIAASAAIANSRGIVNESAISLRTIGRRRTNFIREAAQTVSLASRLPQRREIQLSSFGKTFFDGEPISDTALTPDDLLSLGAQKAAERVMLDHLLAGLQEFERHLEDLLRDGPSDPMGHSRRLADTLDYLGYALPLPRTASNDSFRQTMDSRLAILTDSARCRDALWRVGHKFDRCLIRRLSDDMKSLSRNVEAVTESNRAINGALEVSSEASGWSAIHNATMAITLLVLGVATAWNVVWLGFSIAACMWIITSFVDRYSRNLALRPRATAVKQFNYSRKSAKGDGAKIGFFSQLRNRGGEASRKDSNVGQDVEGPKSSRSKDDHNEDKAVDG